nr:MAG TPA: hypothetical protein [Caudoviricetes sp.]
MGCTDENDAGWLIRYRVFPVFDLLVLEVTGAFGAFAFGAFAFAFGVVAFAFGAFAFGAFDAVEEVSDCDAERFCEALNFRQGQISALVELEGQARAAHTSAGSKLRLRDAQIMGHALDYGCYRHLMIPFYICRPTTTI